MKLAILMAAGFGLAVASCSPKQVTRADELSGQALKDETQRCAHGGSDAARDPKCKAVREQNFDQFMGGSQKR